MFTQLEVDAADHDASASGSSINPHHLNELIIVKEEKPFEGDQPIKSEAYRAVESKLAQVRKTHGALGQKLKEDRTEFIKLSKLNCALYEELMSMYESDWKKIDAHFAQQPLDSRVEKPNQHTSSSSSSSSSLESTIVPTKPPGPQRRKVKKLFLYLSWQLFFSLPARQFFLPK